MNSSFRFLTKVELNEDNLEALKALFESPNWKARQMAAFFMGKIQSKKSYDILTKYLSVESDSDVKAAIISAIGKIKL